MREGKELLVGSVIIASILVAVVGPPWLQGTNGGQEVTEVEVWVRETGGLMEGNTVTYRGVPIGRVSTIAVDTSGAFVRIGLELEGEVSIPEDAQAVVAPESLFGDWQIEIVTLSRFPRFDYYVVEAGYEENDVRVIGGYALPDISRLTAAADEISENLAVLTDRIDRAFNEETADALAQAIRNVQQVSDDIRNLIQQQASTFENVSAQVERSATEIGQAASVGRQSLERFDQLLAQGQIDSVLVNLPTATRNLDLLVLQLGQSTGNIDEVLFRADSALTSLDRVATRLESGEGSLGRLLVDTTLAVRAEAAVTQLQQLLQDIRENPGRYVRLSIF